MPFFINPTLKRTHNILCFNIMFLTIKITNNICPQHNLLINCISAKSACQMLSIKDRLTFLFSNFLIIVMFSNKITNNICPQHNLLINCISAKSAYQILSIKDRFTFFFKFSNNCNVF